MKPLRWKSKYLVGDAAIDNRSRSIVDTLNAVISRSNQVEHCADFTEFAGVLVAATETMLNKVSASPAQAPAETSSFETDLRGLLKAHLPLDARGTPACDDCGMCSLLEEAACDWLGDAFSDRARSEKHGP